MDTGKPADEHSARDEIARTRDRPATDEPAGDREPTSLRLADLICAIRGGERELFREVVRRFERTARAAAFAMTRDVQTAQDVAQEAFVEAFTSLHQLRDPAAFPGWFRRIVFKQADRVVRARAPHTTGLELARTIEDDRPGPEEIASQARLGQEVRRALAGLPETLRVAATLFYLAEQSYAEISDFLVLPLSTVKKRLHDARRHLRNELRPDFEPSTFERAMPASAMPASAARMEVDVGALAAARSGSVKDRADTPEKEIQMTVRAMTVLLNVTDVAKAIDFYRDALGFSCANQWENEGRVRWARVVNGAADIMLNEHGELTGARLERDAYRDTVVYLAVEDADVIYEALQANGYTTSEIFDADYGLREFHMRDLEGYDLAITSPLARP